MTELLRIAIGLAAIAGIAAGLWLTPKPVLVGLLVVVCVLILGIIAWLIGSLVLAIVRAMR